MFMSEPTELDSGTGAWVPGALTLSELHKIPLMCTTWTQCKVNKSKEISKVTKFRDRT